MTVSRLVAAPSSLIWAALLLQPRNASAQENERWTPEVPRVWDDEALATIELPLPSAAHSPRHVSSEYYYSIPARTIYKSYPVYHPDHEPPGYWEWLHEQEPEVVFDPAALETKEDWIRAGELVFTEGNEYSTGSEMEFVRDREGYRVARVALTWKGEFPYGRYFVREKGKVELGTDSCATCHTRVLADGSVIVGGPGNNPLGSIIAYELRKAAANLPKDVEPPRVDKTWNDYWDHAAPWLNPDPGAYVLGFTLEDLADVWGTYPPGVFPRERTGPISPVRTADLIGVEDRPYLDASGLVRQRSLADLMRYAALNQNGDDLSSFGGFIPAAEADGSLPDPSTRSRYSDEQLYALALFIESLEPPPNPNPFDERARRGGEVFEREACGFCHMPPAYTNDHLVPAPGFDPPRAHRETLPVLSTRVGTDPALTLRTRRGTGYYKVPSLRGVWYRGPFFHDGSVATLEHVFDRRRLSSEYVPTGFRGYRVERRAVPGHEFGLELSEEDRASLIAFLKTL
jgi:hypothetical protein